MIGSKKYEEVKDQLKYLNNYNKLERLLTLQQKSYIIHVAEENVDNVRCIVSSCRAMYNCGIFYNEIGTISMMLFYFTNQEVKKVLKNILIKYLSLFLDEEVYGFFNMIEKNQDFRKVFNPKTKTFNDKDMFIPFETYSCTFDLLKSNLEMLKKLL